MEWKWRILALSFFTTWGSYFVYDFPGQIGTGSADINTIEKHFKQHQQQLSVLVGSEDNNNAQPYTNTMNQGLYSIYSWPNVLMAFGWGVLIDQYLGLRKSLLLGTFLIALGTAGFTIGVIWADYTVMLLGRFVYGIGGESLTVGASVLITRWFSTSRGLAMALSVTFVILQSASSFYLTPILQGVGTGGGGVTLVCLVGLGATVFSFLMCIVVVAVDLHGETLGLVPKEVLREATDSSKGFASVIVTLVRRVLAVPASLWLLCSVIMLSYTSYPFVGIAVNYFHVQYGIDNATSSHYVALNQIVAAILCPIIGLLVDRTGRFVVYLALSSLGFIAVYALFLTLTPPIPFMMILFGASGALLESSCWTAIPYACPPSMIGVAFGLGSAMLNLGMAILPFLLGIVLDAHKRPTSLSSQQRVELVATSSMAPTGEEDLPTLEGFREAVSLCLLTSFLALICLVVLVVVDRRSRGGGLLTKSPKERLLWERTYRDHPHLHSDEELLPDEGA